jgi:methylated-DNA-protein-cysteine methyltransferase related protein
MSKPKSAAFARIRAEVIRLVILIPKGKFTTYGSLAVHMNVMARHVAFVMSRLTEEESKRLPWHRVVSADARVSQKMDAELAKVQRTRLEAEGMSVDEEGYIQNDEQHFHSMGVRRNIRWSEVRED